MGCKNVMVYIETAEGKPVNASLEMITGAKTIAEKVTAVVIGAADAAKEAINYGADEAITVAGVEGDESVVREQELLRDKRYSGASGLEQHVQRIVSLLG